jgi:phosphate uptake regulator
MRKTYRLQGIGGSIYVALPKEWLKKFSLGKGSLVEMVLDVDGSLKIKPLYIGNKLKNEAVSRIGINLKDVKGVFNAIVTSYLRGFDIITINFSSSSMEKEVKRILDEARQILLGLEITDMDSSSVTLQVLSTSEGDIPSLIRNMGKIARSMYLDVLNALINSDNELAEAIPLRDLDLNRLYFYVTRTIRKKMISYSIEQRDVLRFIDFRMIAKAIEEIGDEAKKASRDVLHVIRLGIGLGEEVHRLRSSVDRLDEIFKKIIRRSTLSIDFIELYNDMRICEDARREIMNIKNSVAEDPINKYMIFRIVNAYENIAIRIYDVLSLIPSEIELENQDYIVE